MQRIPSLKAMQALEALERLGSASAVADEMALTRSAVSHMLRRLEGEAGFALTEPDGRGLKLTARGRHFAIEARRARRRIKGPYLCLSQAAAVCCR
jgi:LysR family glycine cleavage system transcriptional activator